MIILPELETVVILVPRTGSGSLKRAILETWKDAWMPYRHMEADGVPAGYDRWRRIGVMRDPIDRMWSMYKFLQAGMGRAWDADTFRHSAYGAWHARQVETVENISFEDWLMYNQTAFSTPHNLGTEEPYNPYYTVTNIMPENQKSQFIHLRPDLGTQIIRFETELDLLEGELGISLATRRHNWVNGDPTPNLSKGARQHMLEWHAWDCSMYGIREEYYGVG